jgi:TIR domain
MALDTFISYSSKDKTAADAACAVLERAGIRCWIAPRDIRPGQEYGHSIIEAIDQCRVMVLIFSANANDSRQIHREIERAVSKGVPIIPLRIEEVVPTKSMEYFLGAIHWLDALTPPLEKHLQQLAEAVKALLQIDIAGRAAPLRDDSSQTSTTVTWLDPAELHDLSNPTCSATSVFTCAGKSAPTAVIYYQSKPDFKGTDQFRYQRTNQDNPNDRLNGEVMITVTVK